MERRDKQNYYLDLAEMVSQRGTCLRRLYGAVIVKNDEVIATGYVGAPRGRKNCSDLKVCIRQKLKIPRGERYEMCRSVHAEANAIISAPRDKMIGSSLYLVARGVRRQLCQKRQQLLDVQANDHQRRHLHRLHPRHQGQLPRCAGAGLGGQRRVAGGRDRLLRSLQGAVSAVFSLYQMYL